MIDDPPWHDNEPGTEGPVTVSIARRVRPGREADYERWVADIVRAAHAFPGYRGASVLRPRPGQDEYVILFRFDTYDHLRGWEYSEERARWLDQLEGITLGPTRISHATGLEFWFTQPELQAAHPSPHKMAVVLVIVIYALVLPLGWAVARLLDGWPRWAVTLTVVVLLTYLVMPRVTRLLRFWLRR